MGHTNNCLYSRWHRGIWSSRIYDAQRVLQSSWRISNWATQKHIRVAFAEGTDARFCKEYEIFKNTPDGVFIDKLSGVPLFDTQDRFNSSTGWLSFTKPIDGSVYTKPDNSYGMRRTEIRSKTSDIHLGHVFPDGPNGMPRYCINATVLEFVKRADIKI